MQRINTLISSNISQNIHSFKAFLISCLKGQEQVVLVIKGCT